VTPTVSFPLEFQKRERERKPIYSIYIYTIYWLQTVAKEFLEYPFHTKPDGVGL
jgi:hypothetical protein